MSGTKLLLVLAAVVFAVAAIVAIVLPGHKVVLCLISAGLFLWVLTGVITS